MRNRPWRVRVQRLIEDWVDVQAPSAQEAEQAVVGRPGVISVFAGSAVSAERPVTPGQLIAVQEEME